MPISTGYYRFAPALNKEGNKIRRDGSTTDWWLIIECDREIGRYYRHLYEESRHHAVQTREPLWGTHISVVRGEEPPYKNLWANCEGETVEFNYDTEAEIYDGYVVLPVYSDVLLDYRESLGLSREPAYPLHLTVGNTI